MTVYREPQKAAGASPLFLTALGGPNLLLRMILAPRLALCLLLAGLCIFQAQGMVVTWDCCLSTRDNPLSLQMLLRFKGYEIQDTKNGCPIKAFVFITVRNRKLCYPLDSPVVAQFKRLLDNKKLRSKGKTA